MVSVPCMGDPSVDPSVSLFGLNSRVRGSDLFRSGRFQKRNSPFRSVVTSSGPKYFRPVYIPPICPSSARRSGGYVSEPMCWESIGGSKRHPIVAASSCVGACCGSVVVIMMMMIAFISLVPLIEGLCAQI